MDFDPLLYKRMIVNFSSFFTSLPFAVSGDCISDADEEGKYQWDQRNGHYERLWRCQILQIWHRQEWKVGICSLLKVDRMIQSMTNRTGFFGVLVLQLLKCVFSINDMNRGSILRKPFQWIHSFLEYPCHNGLFASFSANLFCKLFLWTAFWRKYIYYITLHI